MITWKQDFPSRAERIQLLNHYSGIPNIGRDVRLSLPFYLAWPMEAVEFYRTPTRAYSIRSGLPRTSWIPDNSWYFDGPNTDTDSLYFSGSHGLAGAAQATLIFRGYHWDEYNSQCIMFSNETTDPRFGFHVVGGNAYAIANGGAAYGIAPSGVDAYTTWAVVFNGTLTGNAERLKLYKNGAQQTLTFTGTIPATLNPAITRLDIGRQVVNGASTYMYGYHNWIVLYNRALLAREVSSTGWNYASWLRRINYNKIPLFGSNFSRS